MGDLELNQGRLLDYAVAYCYNGEHGVGASFHLSLTGHLINNLKTHRHTGHRLYGEIAEECGTGRLLDGRNDAVRKFLATDCEWLVWLDTDMGFEPDAIDRLLRTGDPVERPIVGGLAFGQRKGPFAYSGARHLTPVPTIYTWVENGPAVGFFPAYDYPRDTLVRCDATGCAFIAVHRRVFEALGEKFGASRRPWYDETAYAGEIFSEDLTFCKRATEAGFPIHVHTGIRTSHHKQTYLTEETYDRAAALNPPTVVVIPQRNKTHLTEDLLRDLEREGGWEQVLVLDNGSDPDEHDHLEKVVADIPGVEIIEAPGKNIHEMWNLGIERAVRRFWRCNVAILNNDLRLGEQPLQRMAKVLRGDPMMTAVSANYDNRDGPEIQPVADICAGRYDGTGGLAGFAFMLRGEGGYRFPEELRWWFGDNDMMLTIVTSGYRAAIVRDAHVTHVDGGGQTADWDAMSDITSRDREWFRDKWSHMLEQPLMAVGATVGRSGSLWVAEVMRLAGLPVTHEVHFNARGYIDGDPGPWQLLARAEWSAQAGPFLEDLASDGVKVWHQVRHPLRTIGSLLGSGLFNDPAALGPEGLFVAEQAGITGDDPLGEACRFWIEQNEHIANWAERFWRVEDFTAELLVELAGDLDMDVPLERARTAVDSVPTDTNTRGNAVKLTWDDLPDEWRDRVRDLASRYGYEG